TIRSSKSSLTDRRQLVETFGDAAGRGQIWNETRLQRMIDVNLAEEGTGIRLKSVVDLRSPSSVLSVDEACSDEAPNPPIPFFVDRSAVDGVHKSRCPHAFATRPPVPVAYMRSAVPTQSVVEAARDLVPSFRNSLGKERLGAGGKPVQLALPELPQLEQQARPLQPVTRRRPVGTKHRAARIIPVDPPILREVLRQTPSAFRCAAANNEVGDPFSHAKVCRICGSFEGRHKRFGQMHVRVLAAIGIAREPVSREFFRGSAELFFPEAFADHGRNVVQQSLCVGMASSLCTRGGKKHKSMAIGLLRAVRRLIVTDSPVVAAELSITMAIPQEMHSMVDYEIRAGTTHQ